MIKESKPLRLVNEIDGVYGWKLLDAEGNNLFDTLNVSCLSVTAGELPKLVLECPIPPGIMNVGIAVLAENIGIKIIEHKIIEHVLKNDTESEPQ